MVYVLDEFSCPSRSRGGHPGLPAYTTYGTGSVLGTLVYAPFKATFCILGGITSGFTFPFAGADTAGRVATAGCGGTWAITPDVLRGREPVKFVGGQATRSVTSTGLRSDGSTASQP